MHESGQASRADLEARVVALQTLVGDLLRVVHAIAPEALDRRLAAARERRDRLIDSAPSEDVRREATHLEVAMLEAALRGH